MSEQGTMIEVEVEAWADETYGLEVRLPVKPVVTSAANKSYQAKFDKLAEMAAAGDWGGVEGYEVKGVNTYAKAVTRYRDALLAAYRATDKAADQTVADMVK